ncbi:hypothetical protein [Pelomonas sp. KK5]|uniref:hypothetical protein n=1 Tax=Pelomonas sp. KK5 TaxID=1855730 RepID=UPI00117E203C|nr:hypothetical protein [Pelomonas sp. KK5]
MSENPFAPPAAAVQDMQPPPASLAPTPWFAISTTKLLVMTLCTLSLYEIYWFYRQWAAVKLREQSDVLPAARAIFPVFFCYSLFAKVRGRGAAGLAAGPLATGWIITALLWRAPGAIGMIPLAGVLFLLPVQSAMNNQNEVSVPGHEPNARFTLWNWLAIVPGGLLLVLALIGVAVEK